jgi:hypothetical protein
MKIYQIEKFNQGQQPAKWAQLFGAGLKLRGSIDFSGLSLIFTKSFTNTVFPGILFPSFNHLGTSCYSVYGLAKPLLNRNPKWFFIFQELFNGRVGKAAPG